MFDGIPITMFFVSVIKAVSVKSRLQPRCGIDEKERIIGEVFLAELSESLSSRLISRQRNRKMQQAVRLRIDRSVQPEPFVIELDHGLVDRNVIRASTTCGL
jgi:hypothetical protein